MSAPGTACALVILSCDARRDLWDPCLALHRRYWPDCPYPAYLVTESAAPDVPPARVRAGGAGAWSDVVRRALADLEQELVLLMLDDFFLAARVDTAAIEACRHALAARDAVYLRLVPRPRPTRRVPDAPAIGEHEPGLPFRASLQAAFWRREALLSLLVAGESAWEFERLGSARSERIPGAFLSTRRTALRYVEALARGRWTPSGRRLCRRERLARDPARPAHSPSWTVGRAVGHLRLALTGPTMFRVRRRARQLAGSWRSEEERARPP